MTRTAAQLPLVLPPRDASVPLGRWLYGSLRAAVLDGRLPPGSRLPATRDLAREYHLSRGTVVTAFDRLQAEGYLEARIGSGTRVARELPSVFRAAVRSTSKPVRRPPRKLSAGAGRLGDLAWFEEHDADRVRAFRANQPALDLFPAALWAQVAARRLRRAPPGLLLGCEPMGHLPLREEVARYLVTSRGVRCDAAQVAIVSGVQEALDLVARLVLDPGDRVAMEAPGYLGATRVFEAAGATISPVRVDAEGLDPADPALRGARLVYLTPAHQFPLGVALSLPRRLALLEWAAATDALVLEDDYDSEYRYSGKPIPTLQGLDRHGQVLLAGSFGKVLFPSLRLGYLVMPPDLVDPVRSLLAITRRHAPLLDQAVLADFLAGGHFGRHLRRMREVYGERLGVLTESVAQRLAGVLDLPPVEAGLQTVGLLRRGIRGKPAAEAAAARGLEVTDIGRYSPGRGAPEGLVLGFAAVSPAEIRRGVRELAAVLEGLTRAR